MTDRSAIELCSRVLAMKLVAEDSAYREDFGMGYLSTFSIGYRHWF